VIGTGCLEKLLKVVSGVSRLLLEIALSSGDELLIRVANITVVVTHVAAVDDHDSLGPPLQPPFVAFGTPLQALVSCLGWRSSTTIEGSFAAALKGNGPDHLLARGMLGGNVEKLLNSLWLVTAELMPQGSPVCVRPERRDDFAVTDFGELMTLLGETSDVVPLGFTLLLLRTLEILGVTRLHVRALKVAGEDLLEILPTIDRVSG
jgi:hypothetical protein